MFKPKQLILAMALLIGLVSASPASGKLIKKEVQGNVTTTITTDYQAHLHNVGAKRIVTNKPVKLYGVTHGQADYNHTLLVTKNTVLTIKARLANRQDLIVTVPRNHNQYVLVNPRAFVYHAKGVKNSWQSTSQLKQASKKWAKGLTKSQIKAIRYYTDKGYTKINTALRTPNSQQSQKVTNSIQEINVGLQAFKLSKPLTVYRGTSWVGLQKSLGSKSVKIGGSYSDPAYSSCTLSQMIGLGFSKQHVLLKVNLPAGNHGAYIDPISTNVGEKEFLMASGTKLIVTKVQKGQSIVHTVTKIQKKGKPAKQHVTNTKTNYTMVTLNLKR